MVIRNCYIGTFTIRNEHEAGGQEQFISWYITSRCRYQTAPGPRWTKGGCLISARTPSQSSQCLLQGWVSASSASGYCFHWTVSWPPEQLVNTNLLYLRDVEQSSPFRPELRPWGHSVEASLHRWVDPALSHPRDPRAVVHFAGFCCYPLSVHQFPSPGL